VRAKLSDTLQSVKISEKWWIPGMLSATVGGLSAALLTTVGAAGLTGMTAALATASSLNSGHLGGGSVHVST
jgi:hypothetical protein